MQRLNSVIILLHCHYFIDGTFHSETFQQAACKQGGDSSTPCSDASKGNRVQHCDIHCPTSLRESTTTTKTAAMTLQCDLATSIQCSWSTDNKFLFSPHRTVSEGVVPSRHRLCLTTVSEGVISSKHRLYLTDRMGPLNKRPTSWAYSLQTPVPVAFLVLGAHLKPLTPLQRLYHKIPLSSTDASRAENVTYHVEANGAGIKTIKPITAKVMHIVMIASKKLKPMDNNFTYFCTATDTQTKPIPAKAHSVLSMASKGQPKFALHFDYRSITGTLIRLAQTSRPDIMSTVRQFARFSANPIGPHDEIVSYLACCLMMTRVLGIRFKPDPTRGFKGYCDTDFSGNWNKSLAARDPATSKSRSGCIIFYAGCLVIWTSILQSQIALSMTKAKYIALSMSLRYVLPIMFLLKEMRERSHEVILCTEPHVFCKVFEDNSGALELARLPKLRPRTKHINVCYHHFREHVRSRLVKIYPVSTHDQVANTLTKALSQNTFQKHRRAMCGQ